MILLKLAPFAALTVLAAMLVAASRAGDWSATTTVIVGVAVVIPLLIAMEELTLKRKQRLRRTLAGQSEAPH